MKTTWRVRLNGKGSGVVNVTPISKEDLLKELKKHWKDVEVLY
jgi:hypothetical protein